MKAVDTGAAKPGAARGGKKDFRSFMKTQKTQVAKSDNPLEEDILVAGSKPVKQATTIVEDKKDE